MTGNLSVGIHGGKADYKALVTPRGELIIAPLDFSEPYYVKLTTAFNADTIVPAKSGKRFVIHSMLIATDKSFSSATGGLPVTIYEANPSDISTNTKTIILIDFLKNDRIIATNLNIITSETVSIVAVADDNNVDITLAGYYVDA